MRSFFGGRTRPVFLACAALALVSLVAACGGDDDDDAPTQAPTTAASATASAAAYPVKVTDMLGRTVEIKSKPMTVVAVSPTAVELVYAAGGTVVGKSASVTYPPEAASAKE